MPGAADYMARSLRQRFTPKPPLSPEELAYAEMNPVDAYKLSAELQTAQKVPPEQAAANRKQNARDALSIIPGPGNYIAAEDAITGAKDARESFGAGKYKQGTLQAALAALSGLGAVTGLPTGKMAGRAAKGASSRTNIFAGPMAKTADQKALATAQDMAAAGVGRDVIWEQTGWFKGADGKWRFEIDDSAARKLQGEEYSGGGITTFKGLEHPELRAAYGETAPVSGFYEYGKRPAGSYRSADASNPAHIEVQGGNAGQARSITLHELQHDVQGREGFARGATVSEYARGPMFDRKAADLQGDLSKALTGGVSSKPTEISGILKYGDPQELNAIAGKHGFGSLDEAMAFLMKEDELRTPLSQYRRTAGEVEARNVEARKDMTAAERRARAPWLTQDVPDNQQIVRSR